MSETKINEMVENIGKLSVLDLSELVKAIEEKFGVKAQSGMPMMAMPAAVIPFLSRLPAFVHPQKTWRRPSPTFPQRHLCRMLYS